MALALGGCGDEPESPPPSGPFARRWPASAAAAPTIADERTGERIGDPIASAEVTNGTYDGLPVVRAALTPTARASPGFVFGAVARGSRRP